MADRLAPYGLADYTGTIAKVGKGKAVAKLAARMPTAEIGAKVSATYTFGFYTNPTHRVVRRKAGGAG